MGRRQGLVDAVQEGAVAGVPDAGRTQGVEAKVGAAVGPEVPHAVAGRVLVAPVLVGLRPHPEEGDAAPAIALVVVLTSRPLAVPVRGERGRPTRHGPSEARPPGDDVDDVSLT